MIDAPTMPIVLRLEKSNSATHEEVCQSVASAFGRLFVAVKQDTSHSWSDAVQEWEDSAVIKKVVRRARGSQWEKAAAAADAVPMSHEGVEVLFFPPTNDVLAPAVKSLQVGGTDVPERGENARMLVDMGVFHACVNPDLAQMSTGKTIAQVCHAVQYAVNTLPAEDVAQWFEHGCPVLVTTDSQAWQAANDMEHVTVTDAGLTEIPAGSETVKGYLL